MTSPLILNLFIDVRDQSKATLFEDGHKRGSVEPGQVPGSDRLRSAFSSHAFDF